MYFYICQYIQIFLGGAEVRTIEEQLENVGRERDPVALDGNCLFEAISRQVPGINALKLRQLVCDYLHENSQQFIGLVADEKTNTTGSEIYSSQLTQLRIPGKWDLPIGDVVVTAASNVLNRVIAIISRIHMIIHPDGFKSRITDETIIIVYDSQVKHYDSTIVTHDIQKWPYNSMPLRESAGKLPPFWAIPGSPEQLAARLPPGIKDDEGIAQLRKERYNASKLS